MKAIMVVGTSSHAGKTLLTAALCRILCRRGWRVAPFKGQNMALNAYVTATGAEIGFAQAVQAWAAKVSPQVDFTSAETGARRWEAIKQAITGPRI